MPARLRDLPQPPKQLFVVGDLEHALEQPCVAIVGSRKVSPYGRAVTQKLANELASRGVVIMSGLALGVDSIAHQATVAAGGKTVAVLPSDLEHVYPASHRGLAERIVSQGGALVSEYEADTPVMKHNFIARNRLIAGLADVLVVTEAALKSGSLHTARFALEQGKDVFAVPGNITSETSEGTNNLIKSGAMPLTAVEDVFARLHVTPAGTTPPRGDTEAEQVILDLLAAGRIDGNHMQLESGLPIEVFSQALTMLELSGKIRALGNNQWSL
jgi:DNA processing protein